MSLASITAQGLHTGIEFPKWIRRILDLISKVPTRLGVRRSGPTNINTLALLQTAKIDGINTLSLRGNHRRSHMSQ